MLIFQYLMLVKELILEKTSKVFEEELSLVEILLSQDVRGLALNIRMVYSVLYLLCFFPTRSL